MESTKTVLIESIEDAFKTFDEFVEDLKSKAASRSTVYSYEIFELLKDYRLMGEE